MVHTRSQKTKEDSDTDLAKQRSLAEQLQQNSVSKQLQHEFEEAPISQPDVSQQDSSLQGTLNGAHTRLYDNKSASDSAIVEDPNDGSFPSIKDVQDIAEAEAKASISVKTEIGDSEPVNDLSAPVGDTIVEAGEESKSPRLTSRPIPNEGDHAFSTPASEVEHSPRYSLRGRAGETGKAALIKIEESTATLGTADSQDLFMSDADGDGDVVDEPAKVSGHDDTKAEDGQDDDSPTKTCRGKKQGYATSKKIAPDETGPKQKSVVSTLTAKKVGRLVLRQKKIIPGNVEADVPVNERSPHAKGRGASGKVQVRDIPRAHPR